MNLLLLLSALLSALTGVGGTRGVAAPHTTVCERACEVRAIYTATAPVAMRPVQAMPAVASVRRMDGNTLVLAAPEPPFASRRRE